MKVNKKLLSLCDTWLDTEKDLCTKRIEFELLKQDLTQMSSGVLTEQILTRRFGSVYVDCKKEFMTNAFKRELQKIAQYRLNNLGKWEE